MQDKLCFSDILSAGSWHTINDFLVSCTGISDSRPTERNNDNEVTMKFITVTCLGPMWFVGCNLNKSKVGRANMHTPMLLFFFIYTTNVSQAVHNLPDFINFNFCYAIIHDWNKPFIWQCTYLCRVTLVNSNSFPAIPVDVVRHTFLFAVICAIPSQGMSSQSQPMKFVENAYLILAYTNAHIWYKCIM